jgi:hypothetical protein
MFTGLSTRRGPRGFLYSGLPARSVSSMRLGSPPLALRSISPSICGSPSLLRRQKAFQTIKTVRARSATLRAPRRQTDRVEGRLNPSGDTRPACPRSPSWPSGNFFQNRLSGPAAVPLRGFLCYPVYACSNSVLLASHLDCRSPRRCASSFASDGCVLSGPNCSCRKGPLR